MHHGTINPGTHDAPAAGTPPARLPGQGPALRGGKELAEWYLHQAAYAISQAEAAFRESAGSGSEARDEAFVASTERARIECERMAGWLNEGCPLGGRRGGADE